MAAKYEFLFYVLQHERNEFSPNDFKHEIVYIQPLSAL